MNTIKFSNNYMKLGSDWQGRNALLVRVVEVDLKDLPESFINYDTEYENEDGEFNYPLPQSGAYLMLLFYRKDFNTIFTTLRRNYDTKYGYYLSNVGKEFMMVKSK